MTFLISIFLFSFYFRVCTGNANGAYIKCSTKFLSGIALIHVSGDFFAGKRYRAGLLGFVSCVVPLMATTNFAVMFAPVPGRGPAHLSDRYSDFQQRFCRFSDSD